MAQPRSPRHLTDETKAKIRAKLLGRTVSAATRAKLAVASTGRRKDAAEREAIRQGLLRYFAAKRAREAGG